MKLDWDKLNTTIDKANTVRSSGKITRIIGLLLEATGLHVELGELCHIKTTNNDYLRAEVVGFRDEASLLMVLDEMHNIKMGAEVIPARHPVSIKAGPEMIGRVINCFGEPIDDGKPIRTRVTLPQWGQKINTLKKNRIAKKLSFGVKAIDGLLTCGQGQRLGIFAGSGIGKSTLLGMIAKKSDADLNVIALVGERGREVREFIEESLGKDGLRKSIVIVATGNEPGLLRVKTALFAHSIAEYFRDEGKNVLLMLDSLTRVALAQREIGLAVGEPSATRGYTPSVFALLPRLIERSGMGEKGSITALYTVLVEGDDLNEPISDIARGTLDGHIVLSRELAHKNHFPAIDILQSISRVMPSIVSKQHMEQASEIRNNLANYKAAEDLIAIGAYQKGTNKNIDKAIQTNPKIIELLQQKSGDFFEFEDTEMLMKMCLGINS